MDAAGFGDGIYDLGRNVGFVNVGTDHDTGAFAVASLLTLLALITLVVKTLVERTGYRRR